MKDSWDSIKIPALGIIAMALIVLTVYVVVAPEKLVVQKDIGTVTGNAVEDSLIFDSNIDLNKECADIYDPVCGTNGITYDNLCLLMKAGAEFKKQGLC